MKKIILSITITLSTVNIFAQFETGIKLGTSDYSDNNTFTTIPTSAAFYTQANFGYRFFNNEHITLIPKLFFSKSGFTLQDLSQFEGLYDSNGNPIIETSDITYRLYNAGLQLNAEIKLLNLEKKTNFYITPNLEYRRVIYSEGIPSNPAFGNKTGSSTIQQNFIIDWGIEIGVKLQKLKFGISYQDVLNKGNRNNSSFVITNAFSFSASYLFGNINKEKSIEEQ